MDATARQQALDIAADLRRHGQAPGAAIIEILIGGYESQEVISRQALESAEKAIALAREATDMLNAVKTLVMLSPDSAYSRALMEIMGEPVGVPDGA